MRITKYGHACFLVEEGEARLLLDPGMFSQGFEGVTGLAAILLTHQHADHVVPETLKTLRAANPEAQVVCDADTSAALGEAHGAVKVVDGGDELEIAGVKVVVMGLEHATIHPEIPAITNVGYLIGDRFFYPGDALTVPGRPVECLALPVEAPWSKMWETIDYLRAVKPRLAIPAHELVSAVPHMQYEMVERFAAPLGTIWKPLGQGEQLEL